MKNLSSLMQLQFTKMCNTKKLFTSSVSGDDLWTIYLNSFLEKDNQVFRDPESSSHNCNLCKNFIRRYGNIVAIDDNLNLMTIWDIEPEEEFKRSVKNVKDFLNSKSINSLFLEDYNFLNTKVNYEKCKIDQKTFKLGIAQNFKKYTKEECEKFGVVNEETIYGFNHLNLTIPTEFVNKDRRITTNTIISAFNTGVKVYQTGLDTISVDALETVIDLINQGSLLNGTTYLSKINEFLKYKKEYDKLDDDFKHNYCLKTFDNKFSLFKNELIGVLCADITKDFDLEKACRVWNIRVDPVNYKKAVAPISPKQIAEAKKFVTENNYEDSFDRRLAVMEDIEAHSILHLNSDNTLKKFSIFDNLQSSDKKKVNEDQLVNAKSITIEDFMKNVLPQSINIEALVSNDKSGNFMTLTTSNNKESKRIFQWDNNFSWTYNGNIAGKSLIKDAVKSRGGSIDGVLNIRLHFPNSTSDYDLHTKCEGSEVYFSNVRNRDRFGGMLDLDAQGVDGDFEPEKRVENITYNNLRLIEGKTIKVWVNEWSRHNGHGFILEIEDMNGNITTFEQTDPFSGNLNVCSIQVKDGKFNIIDPSIPLVSQISKTVYNVDTNVFHKVNLICKSPNHWNENKIGNLHYFFILEDCKADNTIRTFHNENLISELMQHRKVLDILGDSCKVEKSEDSQLSGLGFNSTITDNVYVKVTSSSNKINLYNIKFNDVQKSN